MKLAMHHTGTIKSGFEFEPCAVCYLCSTVALCLHKPILKQYKVTSELHVSNKMRQTMLNCAANEVTKSCVFPGLNQ